MTYPGLPMWNGSSKIHYFMDFGHSLCWRLWRPCMWLSTKSKGHKSNFRINVQILFLWLKSAFLMTNKCGFLAHIEFEHPVNRILSDDTYLNDGVTSRPLFLDHFLVSSIHHILVCWTSSVLLEWGQGNHYAIMIPAKIFYY